MRRAASRCGTRCRPGVGTRGGRRRLRALGKVKATVTEGGGWAE